MNNCLSRWLVSAALVFLVIRIAGANALAAGTLNWRTNENRVTADIKAVELPRVLEGIAKLTGWQVYLESNTTHSVSAKFKDQPPGEALRLLFGGLNFALVPQTNATPRLFVFRTSQANATQLIHPAALDGADKVKGRISNELIVTLKPGAKIEDIARLLGAKITGRMDALNTYRLEFDDDAAAVAARESLLDNPDVAAVDSNFSVTRPTVAQALPPGTAPDFDLKPKSNNGECQVIVGLIDTAIRSLGSTLDPFIMPTISVAGEADPATGLTHGPAMAETILRSVQANTGGNTSVKILPVDVYGNNTSTSTFDVAQGIQKAVNAGANVINMSLGSDGDSTFLHDLIKKASGQGVVFFGAAGNEPVTTPVYPAAYPEVLAVTAGDRQGQIAGYANRGDFVDIVAPGTSVVPYNGQSYIINGTSAATAYASGIAAGLADAARNCPDQVIPALRSKLAVKPPAQ